jgi:hypothetical protein
MDRAVGREIYGGQIKGVRRQAGAGLWLKATSECGVGPDGGWHSRLIGSCFMLRSSRPPISLFEASAVWP